MSTRQVHEAATLAPPADGTRWRVRILEAPRWGSSGYYSREMVERDGPSAFAAGTQMFLDHPGRSEAAERPERSVRDLAGRIASDPVMEADGLYADVELYPWVAGLVREMGPDIGLSIRASAEVTPGQAEGRAGGIITRLVEGISVDLVTRAGAGGRFVTLLESARPSEIGTAVVEETPTPTNHPVTPAGLTPIEENHMPQIEEAARLAELSLAADRVPVLEAERDAAVGRAEAAETRLAAAERAVYEAQIGAALAASTLPAKAQDRVRESLTAALPDDPAATITAAIEAEAAYLAAVTPTPRPGLGFNAAAAPVAEAYTNPWGRTLNPQKGA